MLKLRVGVCDRPFLRNIEGIFNATLLFERIYMTDTYLFNEHTERKEKLLIDTHEGFT